MTWAVAAWAGVTVSGFAFISWRLAIKDVTTQLVKNGDVFLAAGFGGLAAIAGAVLSGSWAPVLWCVGGGLAYASFYTFLVVIAPRQLGSGDIGVAGMVGMFIGTLAPQALIIGWATPFALAAFPSALLWWKRGGEAVLPFVPFLVFSVPVSILIAQISFAR